VYVSAEYERWIAHYEDEQINRLLTDYLELSAAYTCPWFEITPSVSYMHGEGHVLESDMLVEKEYSFPLSQESRLSLKPAVLATFASRTFIPMYTDYAQDDVNYNKIRLVDYEASVSLGAEFRNLKLEATAHYNVPVGAPYEELSPFTFFSVHLSQGLYFRKEK
jgi:hypothetical protein